MLIYFLMLFAFAADRLTKSWTARTLAHGGRIEIHPLIQLQPAYNRGIAFGMFQGSAPLVGWATIAILVGLLLYLRKIPGSMWGLRAGMALIIGGALGNMVDRITMGQVLDFIATPIRPGIFNIADVMINIGILLSLFSLLFQRPKEENVASTVSEHEKD